MSKIKIELQFEKESEIVEIEQKYAIMILEQAKKENITFEEKFVNLLKEELNADTD